MAMGAVMATGRTVRRGTRVARQLAGPLVRTAIDPPLMPQRWRPVRLLERWGREWQGQRGALVASSVDGVTAAAATAAEVVLPLVDLTPVVQGVLERLDLDAVASRAIDDLDLATVVAQVIDELDVGQVVDHALSEVDLTRVVVDDVDLGTVVGAALDQVDLTDVVVTKVDLGAVVYAALDRLDLTEIVTQRVDLAGIAEQVVDDIDLPDLIQESTGSVASEAVQSVRLQSVSADEKISAVADRLLLRVRNRRNVGSGAALEEDSPPEDER
jgi:hypothetical protein